MGTPFGAVLSDFTPVQVTKHVPQRVTLEVSAYAMARAHCVINQITEEEGFRRVLKDVKERFERYAVSPVQIKRRQLVFFPRLADLRLVNGHLDLAAPSPEMQHLRLYDLHGDPKGVDIRARHDSYGKVVDQALKEMYDEDATPPDDIIHVTTSGYLAPNPVDRMVARRGWSGTTVSTCYHKGCYGAFPAIKMAHGFLASAQFGATAPKERVDLVHTELISAHSFLLDFGPENIIVQTLFSDGLIRYALSTEEALRREGRHGLKILAFNEQVLPGSEREMTIVPAPHQFRLGLTPMVPIVVKKHVKAFTTSLLQRAGIRYEKEKDHMIFAVHPGGPKIVDHVQDELKLRNDQVAFSNDVFRENGNMVSSTIPVILRDVLNEVPVGTRIIALGFGPGVTATGLVLEKI